MEARAGERRGRTGYWVWPAALVVAAMCAMWAALILPSLQFFESSLAGRPLTAHMAQHVIFMNAVAPLTALALLQLDFVKHAIAKEAFRILAAATVAQIVLLWGWHAPPVFAMAGHGSALLIAMHGSLFAAALFFWAGVFLVRGAERWRSIVALLVTGKLFCLLGALFIFAPRPLFAHGHHVGGVSLEDQQLAGLLMIVACPLTYIVAGTVIAARWVLALESDRPWTSAEAGAR